MIKNMSPYQITWFRKNRTWHQWTLQDDSAPPWPGANKYIPTYASPATFNVIDTSTPFSLNTFTSTQFRQPHKAEDTNLHGHRVTGQTRKFDRQGGFHRQFHTTPWCCNLEASRVTPKLPWHFSHSPTIRLRSSPNNYPNPTHTYIQDNSSRFIIPRNDTHNLPSRPCHAHNSLNEWLGTIFLFRRSVAVFSFWETIDVSQCHGRGFQLHHVGGFAATSPRIWSTCKT